MEDNFKTFKKYKFNHEENEGGGGSVNNVLGISEEFADEVIKTLRIKSIECEKITETWEATFNQLLPNNAMEAFFIGWSARAIYEMNQGGGDNPMAALMRMMRDR